MRDKLLALEQAASALEPNAEKRKSIRDKVLSYTESFLDKVNDLKESPTWQVRDKGKGILKQPISDQPIELEKAIEIIKENIDNTGLNPASGGHLGYIPGGGIYSASLGDYWADITNRYAGVFYANPGAVRVENHLLNWMRYIMGYPKEAIGNMASGGSIANLIAFVAARDAKEIKSENLTRQVIYLSKQVHHCIDKAIHIAGLREAQIRFINLDEGYRMDADHLKETIQQDKENGLTPFMIVASGGTTDTGAVDPLNKLADISEANNMWFHVDAAYGGFFVLTEEGKKVLSGIERSDSVVIDPHKGLFLPYGLGVVLVKKGTHLRKAFAYQANYMQDTAQHQDEVSPAEVSPELTKHFRGLRLWLPLMIHGLAPFKAALEEKLLLAQYAYKKLKEMDGFEVGPKPELSVVTFRYLPDKGDANEFNARLVKAIHDDGRIFLSSTTIDGVFTLRLAILSFRTHLNTIDFTLDLLREKAELLK